MSLLLSCASGRTKPANVESLLQECTEGSDAASRMRSSSDAEAALPGHRRNHSKHFLRLRAAYIARRTPLRSLAPAHIPEPFCLSDDADGMEVRAFDAKVAEVFSQELHSVYQQASIFQASLLTQLAQHRGLVKFGQDFARAPPLEFIVALPHIETIILQRLVELGQLLARLSTLEVPAGLVRDHLVHTALTADILRVLRCAAPIFEEQRAMLSEEQRAMLSLSAKFSAAFVTPGSVASTCSPQQSRRPSGSAGSSPRQSVAASALSSPRQAWQQEVPYAPSAFELMEVRGDGGTEIYGVVGAT